MNGLEEALFRVEAHADIDWKQSAELAVANAARRGLFTTDDVWAVLDAGTASTHEPRALGAIMRRMAKDGFITATDEWRVSSRPECHGRHVRVWRGLTTEGTLW